jgi:hypothetical protein
MSRRSTTCAKHPTDPTIALAAAISLVLFAWGLSEIVRSL